MFSVVHAGAHDWAEYFLLVSVPWRSFIHPLTHDCTMRDHERNILLNFLWQRLHHKPPNSDAVRRYQGQTLRCYDVLEGQLKKSNGASIIPGGVCAVDYHFEPWIRLHPVAGLTLDKHPLVKKWFDGMSKLEEVNTAYEKVRNVAERVGYGPESSAARRNLS